MGGHRRAARRGISVGSPNACWFFLITIVAWSQVQHKELRWEMKEKEKKKKMKMASELKPI